MASKVLFITSKDIKEKSIIDGNLDESKLLQFIEVAQDLHIQNYIGSSLYRKLTSLILTGDVDLVVNEKYKNLLEEHIKPMLIWYAQRSYLPFAAFKVSNGGIYKHRSENADNAIDREVSFLMSKIDETAEYYTKRFNDFMCYNGSDFPEWTDNQNEDVRPERDVNLTNWNL